MLRILGSSKRLCDAVTRRDMLQAGALALGGLSLPQLLAASTPMTRPVRAKNVILLFLYGGVSQLDTFDPKPEAPADIRGPFGTIATALPGVRISEHLPRLAQHMGRVALVRSMSHPHPIHGVAYTVTGNPVCDIPLELNRQDGRHWPYFGSVLDYLADAQGARLPAVPRVVHLPWVLSTRSHPHQRAGLFGGFLGPRYNPVVAEYTGEGNNPGTYREGDPFGGVERSCQFEVRNTRLADDMTLDRLSNRLSLVEQLDGARRDLERSVAGATLRRSRNQALSVMTSPRLQTALDLQREPANLREKYGQHLFGQSTLLARRLIEAGSRLVSVFWDEFGLSCGAWDTHERAGDRLRQELCPGFDQTYTALLDDLHVRGLLDETLVLCLTEHGRTPRAELRNGRADGRGHWSQAYSVMLAGAGIAAGQVIGRSDAQAAHVADRPVSPKDILHTVYHLLGIDPHHMIPDRLGRPLALVPEGDVVRELIV